MPGGKKILIVEDDVNFYNLVRTALELKGYNIVHVSNGMEAVSRIREEMPDLVLLDIVMPGASGLDILQELKGTDDTKGLKVVMLTNFGTDENVNRAMGLGAEDYFMKYNVVPTELPDKIATYLGEVPSSGVSVTN